METIVLSGINYVLQFWMSLMAMVTICGVVLSTVGAVVVLDWRVNIVEATVIILAVGLSFDFTLHYAVAYQLAPKGTRLEKITFAFGFIGLPVLLSALTTFLVFQLLKTPLYFRVEL